MDRQEIISRLIDAGLVANYLGGTNEKIMGGISCEAVPVDAGVINVYQQAFLIYRTSVGWMVRVAQPGKLDIEAEVTDLDQALAVVLDGYGKNALTT